MKWWVWLLVIFIVAWFFVPGVKFYVLTLANYFGLYNQGQGSGPKLAVATGVPKLAVATGVA
jgi:hypothetical protein